MTFRSRVSTRNIAFCGVMCAAAMILSYLEGFLPVSLLTGIPGIKLGFANIAVIIVFYSVGAAQAAAVSFLRIALSALLFGSVTSFLFSLFGGVLSFVMLAATKPVAGKFMSIVGVSMLCAASHNCGQIIAAAITLRSYAVFSYLPILVAASVPCGIITGSLALLLYRKVSRAYHEMSLAGRNMEQ